jgi:hypothetical protein
MSNEIRILWRVDSFLGNARNTHAANNTGAAHTKHILVYAVTSHSNR